VRSHFDATRRQDGAGATTYRLPITEADFDRLHKGHVSTILTLRRYPPSLTIAMVPAVEVRYLPADYEVREVPLLIGPEAEHT